MAQFFFMNEILKQPGGKIFKNNEANYSKYQEEIKALIKYFTNRLVIFFTRPSCYLDLCTGSNGYTNHHHNEIKHTTQCRCTQLNLSHPAQKHCISDVKYGDGNAPYHYGESHFPDIAVCGINLHF